MESVLSLCADVPDQVFAVGEELLGPNGRGRMLVLVEGEVGLFRHGMLVVRLHTPGELLGEMSALLGTRNTASVIALAPTRCRVIPDAAAALAQHPELLLFVARLLARRLNAVTGYLADIKHQFGGEDGHLGLMDEILAELMSVTPLPIEPGSARDDVPDY